MPQPWVVSDFDDCQIVSASLPTKRRTGTTKRPLSSLDQDASTREGYGRNFGQKEISWSVKHSPKIMEDLIVAKAKVTELFNVLANKDEPRIILLVGPPGCGKSVTASCVAKTLNLNVVEWAQPSNCNLSVVDVKGNFSNIYEPGIFKTFSDFVLNTTSYEMLSVHTEHSRSNFTLIEELPMFKSESCTETMFHDLLRSCASCLRNHVCFILTSNAPNADPPDLHRLFPQRLRDELHIFTLSFNAIPPRTLTKFLTNVATAEKIYNIIPSNCISEIVETCEGDLRSALNRLQFFSRKTATKNTQGHRRGPKERKLVEKTKSSSKKDVRNEHSFSLGKFLQLEDDTKPHDTHSLLLFRAIGRVLNCKRISPSGGESFNKNESRPRLPSYLKQFESDPLSFDPVSLLRYCPVSPSTFVNFLEHNAPSFYSSIDDLSVLSERYLSVCDLLFSQWDSPFENNSELAGLLAIFSAVNCNSPRRRFENNDCIKSFSSSQRAAPPAHKQFGTASGQFRPLYAPPLWSTRKSAEEHQKMARKLVPAHLTTCSDTVIADYISYARTTRNLPQNKQFPGWLKELGCVGEMGRSVRQTTLSTAASNFDEEAENNFTSALASCLENSNEGTVMSNEDTLDCMQQNKAFLHLIKDDD